METLDGEKKKKALKGNYMYMVAELFSFQNGLLFNCFLHNGNHNRQDLLYLFFCPMQDLVKILPKSR